MPTHKNNSVLRVRELHDKLIPPSVRALIRQRYQMLEKLELDPWSDARRSTLAKILRTDLSLEIGCIAYVLEQESPCDLIALHAALTVLAQEIQDGHCPPDLPDHDMTLLKYALGRLQEMLRKNPFRRPQTRRPGAAS